MPVPAELRKQAAKDAQLAVGAEPIDEIIAALDASEEQWAKGAALYGPGGLFDAQRVAMLAVIALWHRDDLQKRGQKVTDDLVKQLAHADPKYLKWLKQQTKQRTEWLMLDAERNGLMMVANRGQALMRVAGRV